MPRVYDSTSGPIDFCKRHFPTERQAELEFGDVGDGPDGRGNCFGYDCDHPDYEDDPDMYKCYVCERVLTARDA